MLHAVGVDQLSGLCTVIRLLGAIREIPDATDRSEVLTKAQILLTAFVFALKPCPAMRRTLSGSEAV